MFKNFVKRIRYDQNLFVQKVFSKAETAHV